MTQDMEDFSRRNREKLADDQIERLLGACAAVLMFFHGGEWTAERRAEWKRITGSDEATTKVLCDHIRNVSGAGVSMYEQYAGPAREAGLEAHPYTWKDQC